MTILFGAFRRICPADDVLATHYTAVVTGGGGMGLGEFLVLSIPGRWWSQLTRKGLTLSQLAEGIKPE